jgi:hypothetical protein
MQGFIPHVTKPYTLKTPCSFAFVGSVFILVFVLGAGVGQLVWDMCPPFSGKIIQGFVKLSTNKCHSL